MMATRDEGQRQDQGQDQGRQGPAEPDALRIAFRGLTVAVGGGQRLLDEVSGGVAPGEVTAVVGPSGAGKSTLLGVLAGLVRPDAGSLWFGDREVTRLVPEERRLGVVFQDLRLFPFLTGRENVAFGPRVLGLSGRDQDQRVAEALELARAGGFAERPVRLLSGGERQRIALARALALRPRGLLLDEPFGALDAELRRELRDELRELVRRLGMTTMIITHDAEDAFALASRMIVLRGGRVEQTGTLPECYHRPASAYVATLLGEAVLLRVMERQGERARLIETVGAASATGTAGATGAAGTAGTAGTAGAWIPVVGEGARVVVRPEQLVLVAEGEGDLVGQLVDARFVAGRWRMTVELAGGGTVVALVERPPAGREVALRIASTEPLAVVP